MDFTKEGYKGYSLSADYTIAKGMKYGITWSDLKGRETATIRQRCCGTNSSCASNLLI